MPFWHLKIALAAWDFKKELCAQASELGTFVAMTKTDLIPIERIQKKILLVRGEKVMLDQDLAELYGVRTGQLTRQVRRNLDRFPSDFMFQLSDEEFEILRSQTGISSWGGRRYHPYAFTEQGVAMLSSVLSSKRAVEVNIQIMRAFVQLRQILSSQEHFRRKLAALERKLTEHDAKLIRVFEAIRQLMVPIPQKDKRQIGFVQPPKKK
jgi:phage regulator Rha-like protein